VETFARNIDIDSWVNRYANPALLRVYTFTSMRAVGQTRSGERRRDREKSGLPGVPGEAAAAAVEAGWSRWGRLGKRMSTTPRPLRE